MIIDADAAVLVDPLFQAVSQRPQSAENAIFPRPGTGEHRDSDLRSAQLTSSITCKPEIMLMVELIRNSFNLIFSWFALANLWLTFSIIIQLLPDATGFNMFGTTEIVSCVVV
jgi:hypothetical protein